MVAENWVLRRSRIPKKLGICGSRSPSKSLGICYRPFYKGPGGNTALGGMHNQSYLQFQIRYRNCFGIVRKGKIRAFKCNRFQVFILSGTGDMNQTPCRCPCRNL
eukprot:sb/3477889/